MGFADTLLTFLQHAIATWFGAAFIGGVLIALAEWWWRRAEPSNAEVARAAARYRQTFGRFAFEAIGEHMLAASFSPDGRHRRFLRRVAEVLVEGAMEVNGLAPPTPVIPAQPGTRYAAAVLDETAASVIGDLRLP